jgi:hypothetical protein
VSDETTDDERGSRRDTGAGASAEPLGDLARRVRARRAAHDAPAERDAPETDAPGRDGVGADGPSEDLDGETAADDDALDGSASELFEEVDISDIDAERIWESVLDGETASPSGADPIGDGPSTPGIDPDPAFDPDSAEADDERSDHVVRTREYCQSCHFFTAPPEATCGHDGSEILEAVDSERFRVRNCPVVAGRVDTDGTVLVEGDGGPTDPAVVDDDEQRSGDGDGDVTPS